MYSMKTWTHAHTHTHTHTHTRTHHTHDTTCTHHTHTQHHMYTPHARHHTYTLHTHTHHKPTHRTHTTPHTHSQAEDNREAGPGHAIAGASRADMPVPSRIELSKNFSIISMEDIPMVLEEQTQEHPLYYP